MKKYLVFIMILLILTIAYGWENEKTKTREEYHEWTLYSSDATRFINDDISELLEAIDGAVLNTGHGADNFIILNNADTKKVYDVGMRLQNNADEALERLQEYPPSPLINDNKIEYMQAIREYRKAGECAVRASEYWESFLEKDDFSDSADFTESELAHINFVQSREYISSGLEHSIKVNHDMMDTIISLN